MYLNRLCILTFYLLVIQLEHKVFTSRNKPNNIGCGILRKSSSAHVVGGNKTEYMQYPWMASIMIWDKVKLTWEYHCAGTLINSKFVVTAGHCFYTPEAIRIEDNKAFRVTLGMNKISKKEAYRQDLCIKSTILHEEYNFTEDTNDIGLMQLYQPVKFQTTKIRPICLPDKNDNNNLYKGLGIVAGWGVTKIIDNLPVDELEVVSLPIAEYKTCVKELISQNTNKHLFNTTICTHSFDSGKDACSGDSGGPLMGINKKTGLVYLRGIVSFGSPSCEGFGVYTKVSFFLDWIYKTMKKLKNKNTNSEKVGKDCINNKN